MSLLNREQLLAKQELQIEKVPFDDGSFVYVREMNGHERDRFERSLMIAVKDKKGKVTSYDQNLEDFRAKLVVNVICDETGVNILKPEDFEILSKNMGAAKLEKIVNKAQELNKITEADKEEMTKNLEPGPNGSNTSESAGN